MATFKRIFSRLPEELHNWETLEIKHNGSIEELNKRTEFVDDFMLATIDEDARGFYELTFYTKDSSNNIKRADKGIVSGNHWLSVRIHELNYNALKSQAGGPNNITLFQALRNAMQNRLPCEEMNNTVYGTNYALEKTPNSFYDQPQLMKKLLDSAPKDASSTQIRVWRDTLDEKEELLKNTHRQSGTEAQVEDNFHQYHQVFARESLRKF